MKANRSLLLVLTLIAGLSLLAGCSSRDVDELDPASGNTDPLVFDDAYAPDVYFQPFFETHYLATSIDSVFAYDGFQFDGARSLKFEVPPAGSALGRYLGGVLTSAGPRNLTGYNALSFWARSDQTIFIDEMGYGNDNTGTSQFGAGTARLAVTPEWQYFVIPIPAPDRLISERGLLTISEATEEAFAQGYNIWLDEIRYTTDNSFSVFRAQMSFGELLAFVGMELTGASAQTIYQSDEAGFRIVSHSGRYFDYFSSDESVASPGLGNFTVVGAGTANITAKLGDTDVVGTGIDLTAYAPPASPAPAPSQAAGNVISLFSDTYDDIPVETWQPNWGFLYTNVIDYAVGGNAVKIFSSFNYTAALFEQNLIDASDLTHLHMDLYAPVGTDFAVRLGTDVGEGAESSNYVIDGDSTPAFEAGTWISLDIPLATFDFGEDVDDPLTALKWIIFSSDDGGDTDLLMLDNVYFY